jgi:hypothetical protein
VHDALLIRSGLPTRPGGRFVPVPTITDIRATGNDRTGRKAGRGTALRAARLERPWFRPAQPERKHRRQNRDEPGGRRSIDFGASSPIIP